jgi:hypothetical protein
MLHKITVSVESTGAVLESWVVDDTPARIKLALERSLSLYDDKDEYNEAHEECEECGELVDDCTCTDEEEEEEED